MDYIIHFDQTLFNWINQDWSCAFLDIFLVPWRNSLTWMPLYTFVIAFYFFNFGKKGYWILLFTLLTVGTSDIVSSRVIKPSVERLRPCHDGSGMNPIVKVRCGSGYSFTSSHATNHFALASFWFFTLGIFMKWWKYLLFLWAGLIGIAQIYVGVHFPLDIICGSFLGIGIGYLWSFLFKKYYESMVFSDYIEIVELSELN